MDNKRAQGTPVWIIIALVLGVLVLVVLAIGFTQGWGTVWNKLTGWTGGSETLSDASQSCKIAAASGDDPALSRTRTVKEASDSDLGKICSAFEKNKDADDENNLDCAKIGEEEFSDKIGDQTVTITKDKVVKSVTCEILKSTGLISY